MFSTRYGPNGPADESGEQSRCMMLDEIRDKIESEIANLTQ